MWERITRAAVGAGLVALMLSFSLIAIGCLWGFVKRKVKRRKKNARGCPRMKTEVYKYPPKRGL